MLENKIKSSFKEIMKDKDELPDWFIDCFGEYQDFKKQVKIDIKNNNLDENLSKDKFIEKVKDNIAEAINDQFLMKREIFRAKHLKQRDGYH